MKRLWYVLIFVLLIGHAAWAQPKFKLYPDSIRVELPEQSALVVFEFREFSKSEDFVRNFGGTLQTVLENIKKGSSVDLSQSSPMRIDVVTGPEGRKEVGLGTKPYGERQQITLTPVTTPQTRMTLLKDHGIVELLPPGWELYLSSKDYKVMVYGPAFANLELVAQENFGTVADALVQDPGYKKMGKKSIESRQVIRDRKVDQHTTQFIYPGDMISLGVHGGVGILQNIFYPELSVKLGLMFRDRMRRPNLRPSLVANQLYFAEQTTEGFHLSPNTFLTGMIEVNFDKRSGKASWSGLGFGFLVNRTGNYFQGNTARFFITHTLSGSRFSLAPEFYLTDDFKKFNFGMTLRYSF